MTTFDAHFAKVFYPYTWHKMRPMLNGKKQRFVHYTSADAAMSMIRNKEVWMRKASMMNDFSEVEYGIQLITNSYRETPQGLKKALDYAFKGLSFDVELFFNGWISSIRAHTYITSLSEHDESEDSIGRLSMWRAYGGAASVAFVINPSIFVSNSTSLGVFSSPVAYLDQQGMRSLMNTLSKNIFDNIDYARSFGRDGLKDILFHVLHFAAVSTKHLGFQEEREWRVIFNPEIYRETRVEKDIVSIKGMPQTIFKIPLQDDPQNDIINLEIPKLIDRFIIGPTNHPTELQETFVELLSNVGLEDAQSKVIVSEIPLRV
jgi:hypothetical protein